MHHYMEVGNQVAIRLMHEKAEVGRQLGLHQNSVVRSQWLESISTSENTPKTEVEGN